MNDFDVLIIGGYSLTEVGGAETKDKLRLYYKNSQATVDFIRTLVENQGNLESAEKSLFEANKSKLIHRSLNTIYLLDFLSKNNIRTEAINYFLLEQNKFKELMSFKPKVVAISTTFISDSKDINTIAKAVKETAPDSVIIAGGIKILKSFKKYVLYNKNYFEGFDIDSMKNFNFFLDPEMDKHIDIYVIEENGELTLVDLVRRILRGKDYKATPNIAYREKEKLVFTERIPEPYTFEQNLIAWDKVPADIVGNEIPVRAGMGCPFRCAFCDFVGLHKVRTRTIASLIEELKLIQEAFPERNIFFTDDNLFVTRRRTRELAEAIVKNGLHFKWRAFFRVDAISEDNVEILAKSGCVNCLLGVESGDDNILINMNKKTSRAQILKTIDLLNQNRISTLSTMIIGFPGETKESVDNTISLLNSIPKTDKLMNFYCPFCFILLPLAPINVPENRRRHGISGGYEDWSHNTMSSQQAKEELVRVFKEVDGPFFQYKEQIGPAIGISPGKVLKIFKARESIVKSGINMIDENNVLRIYEIFRKVLNG